MFGKKAQFGFLEGPGGHWASSSLGVSTTGVGHWASSLLEWPLGGGFGSVGMEVIELLVV